MFAHNNINVITSDSIKNKSLEYRDKRFNVSIGIGDSRNTLSALSLSYDIFQKNNDEIFLGCGTFFLLSTLSTGWKHYFFENKSSPFTIISLQNLRYIKLGVWGSSKYIQVKSATLTIGKEYKLSRTPFVQPQTMIKFGINLSALFEHNQTTYLLYPIINCNLSF